MSVVDAAAPPGAKFSDPDVTAKGERRAGVALQRLATLWINTGTLCNLTCANCYIEFEPQERPAVLYHRRRGRRPISTRSRRDGLATEEIGFTGGEPFMNPEFIDMVGGRR